jgi:hypothetical protein
MWKIFVDLPLTMKNPQNFSTIQYHILPPNHLTLKYYKVHVI